MSNLMLFASSAFRVVKVLSAEDNISSLCSTFYFELAVSIIGQSSRERFTVRRGRLN